MTASILVASHTGAIEIVARDTPGGPAQVHDFDLVLPDGRVLALEVTMAANPHEISQWTAIGQQNWRSTKLADTWTLSLFQVGGGPGAQIKKLRKRCEAHLAVLEEHGLSRFEGVNLVLSHRLRDAIEALRGLGVRRGSLLEGTKEPWIYLASSGAYMTSPQAVNAAVEPLAQDNAAKLLKAIADERHIFVWIDSTIHGAELMLNDDLAPEDPIDLPSGIDTAWVAREAIRPTDPVSRLWRATPSGGWKIIVGRQRP